MAYCDRCERYFVSDRALLQHISSSYNHDWCDVCSRDFSSPTALEQHRKNSSNHYYCKPCDREFNSENSLEDHYAKSSAHSYCRPCKRFFQNDNNLAQHLRSSTHAGRNVDCPLCDRSFPSYGALTLHLESGTCRSGVNRKIVNNVVQSCDRNHLITDKLITYHNTTTVETWATDAAWNGYYYECYFCNREFNSLSALNNHLRSPAHEQKIYKCPKCQVRFSVLSGLVQHVESESCGLARFTITNFARGITSNIRRRLLTA